MGALNQSYDPQQLLPADVTPYTDRITSEHADKPRFVATVETTAQPLADTSWLEQNYYLYYDVDLAVGTQLDVIGVWVGRTVMPCQARKRTLQR